MEVNQAQRAQELRKFFEPFDQNLTSDESDLIENNSALSDDGALGLYAEAIAWRLGATRAAVSLVDHEVQYFLAGAVKNGSIFEQDSKWFGCATVDTPGGLCENTIALPKSPGEYPYFFVPDLSEDSRFCGLPVVDGSVSAFRFYAGTPITTSRGVNIGSLFFFDDKPRHDGLDLESRKWFCKISENVMRHLETKREAAERRRVALMSEGMAEFLSPNALSNEPEHNLKQLNTLTTEEFKQPYKIDIAPSEGIKDQQYHSRQVQTTSTADLTLMRASRILCKALELRNGGVAFYDINPGGDPSSSVDIGSTGPDETTSDYEDDEPMSPELAHTVSISDEYRDQFQGSRENRQVARLIAMCCGKGLVQRKSMGSLTNNTMLSLVKNYPRGNVWYIDEDGFFSSLDQIETLQSSKLEMNDEDSERSMSSTVHKRQKAEAKLFSQVFDQARQVIFMPLWNAKDQCWDAGCFAWSQLTYPVFTVDSELGYLAAFANSVMAEISRLDAIAADQMKANFISSISHEFRSPLHGILASADLMRETNYDDVQASLIANIHTCSYTLLDTVNHVLDYSKINSFDKGLNQKSGLPHELDANINVAVLCEEIIDGMIAARGFKEKASNEESSALASPATSVQATGNLLEESKANVEIVLDFEKHDWIFFSQPGAFRRIVMNIFGNAQKYTNSGCILVKLRIQQVDKGSSKPNTSFSSHTTKLLLTIQDSGRGMSTGYMNKSLYRPFAQENTFASGVGLGLSIVRSIVKQLKGTIRIQSDVGKGTTVEITLPMNPVTRTSEIRGANSYSDVSSSSSEKAEHLMNKIHEISSGRTVGIHKLPANNTENSESSRELLQNYLREWFGFKVVTFDNWDSAKSADLIITHETDQTLWQLSETTRSALGPIFLICQPTLFFNEHRLRLLSGCAGCITNPAGPYKLAECIVNYFLKKGNPSLAATEIPLIGPTENALTEANGEAIQPSGRGISTAPPFARTLSAQEVIKVLYRPGDLDIQQLPPPTDTEDPMSARKSSLTGEAVAVPHRPHMLSSTNTSSSTIPTSDYPLHILAVDDNEINLQLLVRFLSKRKANVVDLARNGAEAVAAFQKAGASDPYDVIFMDLSMPVCDGFEATRQIRQSETSLTRTLSGSGDKLTRVNIVAVTGLASQRDRDEALTSGFDDFLTKPITFKTIQKVLAAHDAAKEV